MKPYASFRDIRNDLQRGSLSCQDLVRHHLSNIRQKEHLNAFLSVYEAEALTRAAEIDQKLQSGKAGKLAGLVVGIKDVLAYKDHPLQGASRILDGFISQYNATAVQRLLDEDAIIIGRQNCDEFAMGSSNENSAFGPVKNDLDNTRVPGGSSGGSAVAVMADLCQISLGSDTGGSVRQPAAFCGVVGLKPTYSRISRHGLIAYGSSFDCIGIFGKCVEDIALVLEVIAGADAYDSTVSQKPVPLYSSDLTADNNKSYRIAYIRELSSEGLQPEIRENILAAINRLKADGYTVEEIDFPLMEYILPTYYILATAEASSNLSRFDGVRYGYRSDKTTDLHSMYKKTRSEGFGKEVQRRILLGTFVLSARYYDAYYTKAQKVRRIIREKTKEILTKYDFIVMPITPTTAFKLGEHTDNPLEMYLADLFSVQANVVGVPAISVPCGKDRNGLPIGLQVIADDFEESKLLHFSNIIMKSGQA
ncbi:Asp-tRNA(Asn)/Glu-tRNA(Gln) amidotransferase subunit GatA [Fulvivirgaceae bacterium PWU4]|uniref:Glutamyl-tRNA(Gln) amidotransferase subunit A n=1 Tax=Chryseosolibacter histidini TaxID=2782349 RepID=A0AAP2GSD8_9BACT|nr:Asp-tRNA(Asn)/Glu-tRNA(Gln) amidotransferase subunit GatA [Chryseosolibacter histidini]MBT1700582.1 Asp-tRNA(Asn)/Glu-tRNA(Gln) amidotransferase subunit GatA [Chryseosolibacter histidini]